MLGFIYNSYVFVRAAFTKEYAKMNQYDPYQVDQLKAQFNFNPYHTEQDVASVTDVKRPAHATDEDDDEEDCNESMVVIDKRNLNKVQVQDEAECYFKRIRTLARNATGNAIHAFIYGVITAYEFIWTERPLPQQSPIEPKKKMRGFGVDFAPLVERPAALQFHIERAEKEIREICENNYRLQAQKSCGFPFKTLDDHEWGLVETDYNVYYKRW